MLEWTQNPETEHGHVKVMVIRSMGQHAALKPADPRATSRGMTQLLLQSTSRIHSFPLPLSGKERALEKENLPRQKVPERDV